MPPRWVGNESAQPDDPRVSKAAADLALLLRASQAAFASLGDLRVASPARLSADMRMRVAGLQQLCEVVATHAQQLSELLEARGGSDPS